VLLGTVAVAVNGEVAVAGDVAVGVNPEPDPDPDDGLSPTSTNPRIDRALIEVNVREGKGISLMRGL